MIARSLTTRVLFFNIQIGPFGPQKASYGVESIPATRQTGPAQRPAEWQNLPRARSFPGSPSASRVKMASMSQILPSSADGPVRANPGARRNCQNEHHFANDNEQGNGERLTMKVLLGLGVEDRFSDPSRLTLEESPRVRIEVSSFSASSVKW